MKVHDQADALVDALAEQYGIDDLPGALSDVVYTMLTRAAIKGLYGDELTQVLSEAQERLDNDGLSF